MFIQAPNSYVVVNMGQVSHLTRIFPKRRVIFNFSHSVGIKDRVTGSNNIIANYQYINCNSEEEFNYFWSIIMDYVENDVWLIPSNENNHVVNPQYISHISIDEPKNRIIFNLSTSIHKTIKDEEGNEKKILTSDFIFWEHSNKLEFEKEYTKVMRILGV